MINQDISPALQWSGVPPATKSLALICDDPDAPMGTWVHWVIYDLPPVTAGLAEGVPKSPELANGAKQGVNDYKRIGYGGPGPPPGKPHRYFFKLYALDVGAQSQARPFKEGVAQGHGRPHPRRGTIDGNVSNEVARSNPSLVSIPAGAGVRSRGCRPPRLIRQNLVASRAGTGKLLPGNKSTYGNPKSRHHRRRAEPADAATAEARRP